MMSNYQEEVISHLVLILTSKFLQKDKGSPGIKILRVYCDILSIYCQMVSFVLWLVLCIFHICKHQI